MNRGVCLLRFTFTDRALQLPTHKNRDSIKCTEGAAGIDAKKHENKFFKKVEERIKWHMLNPNWYN